MYVKRQEISAVRESKCWPREYSVEIIQYETNNSIDQSPSAANSFSNSKIILHILHNLKFLYHIHKSPPLLSVLCQNISVHIPRSFREIHFNIILPSTPRSSMFPSDFPTNTPYSAPLPLPVRVTCFAHLITVHLIIRIFGENCKSQISALCSRFHSPLTSSLRPNTFLSTLLSDSLRKKKQWMNSVQ